MCETTNILAWIIRQQARNIRRIYAIRDRTHLLNLHLLKRKKKTILSRIKILFLKHFSIARTNLPDAGDRHAIFLKSLFEIYVYRALLLVAILSMLRVVGE